MIERYTRPEMGAVWTDQMRFQKMLEVELAVCAAWAQLGKIPRSALKRIQQRAAFDVQRILEIEQQTKHDVIAFLTCIAEKVGEDSRFIHMGLTSSDALDTGLALQLKEAARILDKDITALLAVVRKKAKKHKDTVMAGRSHNVHAEPITFGLKLALWHEEMSRNLQRLREATDSVCVGKLSGAVGTFSNIDPRIEPLVLKNLGLGVESVANQVVQRDRHAHFLSVLALIGASLEKFATEIRNLQHTEILEVEEFFAKGQKGSSAMPHKRNPIACERICGLARLLRGNALAAMENVALWHERDISHSSVERVIIPDSTIILDYCLALFTEVVDKLLVYPENMRANLEKTRGLMFSQRVLLALVEKGFTREQSYQAVQRNALRVWQENRTFQELLQDDAEVQAVMSAQELAACFDEKYFLRNIEVIYQRIGW
ncbi:MAG: adenylosuccinate lyase [Candidatus Omnitrophica bacterium]|nr:adenylosuccinate lyase [Candidatus Omnitrophota bacterium]